MGVAGAQGISRSLPAALGEKLTLLSFSISFISFYTPYLLFTQSERKRYQWDQ